MLAVEFVQKTLVWTGSVVLAVAIGAGVFLAARERALHSRSAIREKYRGCPALILGITEPINFNEVATLEDGGTISITLTDATGTKFQACIDERDWGGPSDMYIGADYPTHDGATKVLRRGPEEAAFFGLLIRWCEADPERTAVYGMTVDQYIEWANSDGGRAIEKLGTS
jgi:hypothetical protein